MFNPKSPEKWRQSPELAHRDKAMVKKQRGIIDEIFAWSLARLKAPAQSKEDAQEEARIMKAVGNPTLSVLPNDVKDKILSMVQTLDDRDPPKVLATIEEHVRAKIKPGDNLATIKDYIKVEILALQTSVTTYLSELEVSGRCLDSTANSTLNRSLAEVRSVPPSRPSSAGPAAGVAGSQPPSRPPSAGPAAGTRSQPFMSFSEFDPELELDELMMETADLTNVDMDTLKEMDNRMRKIIQSVLVYHNARCYHEKWSNENLSANRDRVHGKRMKIQAAVVE